jgi:hypothetical protein
MSGKVRRDRSWTQGCLGTEGAALLDTWLPPTSKGGHHMWRRQGVPRVKVFRPYEDTLEAFTTRGVTVIPLCLKPFVRNGKGVIGANDYTQGSPINSEPLVMKRTHCNDKRLLKATACFSVSGLQSNLLVSFTVLLSVSHFLSSP